MPAVTAGLSKHSGDTVSIETMMHSHDKVQPGMTIAQAVDLRKANPGGGPHSMTGPIFVNGAEPGDVLEALVMHLRLTIEKLKRDLFGARNERKARLLDQMELRLEGAAACGRKKCILLIADPRPSVELRLNKIAHLSWPQVNRLLLIALTTGGHDGGQGR